MGPSMSRAAVVCVLFTIVAAPALAGDQYALVVTGASGGEAYAQKYDKWRTSFVETLKEKFGYADDRT